MALLNDLNPNELFRFVKLRGPKKERSDSKNAFVTHGIDSLSAQELSDIETNGTLLWTTLMSRAGNPDVVNLMRSDLDSFKSSQFAVHSRDDFDAMLPKMLEVFDWVDANRESMTEATFTTEVESILGDTIVNYVGAADFLEKRYRIWDNLFYQVLVAHQPIVIPLLGKTLSTFKLFERIANSDTGLGENGPMQIAYRAQSLVPKKLLDIIPAHTDADDNVGSRPEPSESDNSVKAKALYGEYISAAEEIKSVAESKRLSLNGKRRSVSSQPITSGGNRIFNDAVSEQFDDIISRNELSDATLETLEKKLQINGDVDTGSTVDALRNAAWSVTHDFDESSRGRNAIRIGDTIIESDYFCHNMIDKDPCSVYAAIPFKSKGSFFNSVEIADLLVTKQQLIKYALGEVAHIETIMNGETRSRTFRRLDRTEETTYTSTETTTETERESQSTDRFEMEKQTSKVVAQELAVSAGINFSADWGIYQLDGHTDFSYGWSQVEQNQSATSFSKEVTTRALQRIKESVKNSKTVTVVHETEDTAEHTFENVAGPDHVNGVYRWLDKFYLNKIINYGKRMMFEFTIPEPAAFYIFQQTLKPEPGLTVEKPYHPRDTTMTYTRPSKPLLPDIEVTLRLTDPTVIDEYNYRYWAAQYDAEVPVYPEERIYIGKELKLQVTGNADGSANSGDSVVVPEGYQAVKAYVNWEFIHGQSNNNGIVTLVGFERFFWAGANYTTGREARDLQNEARANNTIPVSVKVWAKRDDRDIHAVVNVQIRCMLNARGKADWQNKVYAAIVAAYNNKMKLYEEWKNSQLAYSGFEIEGNNPAINRQIEKSELKRRCLEMFSGQRWESFDAAVNGILNESGYPEIQFKEAIKEGNIAKFFEQAFDWQHMAYIFYPTHYGRKNNWLSIEALKDNDPVFQKFLKAGQARVVVPATLGFESLLQYYAGFTSLYTWWHGESAPFPEEIFASVGSYTPGIHDISGPWQSIAVELMQNAELVDDVVYNNATPPEPINLVGTYVEKVPTNLVYLANPDPNAPPPGDLPDNSGEAGIVEYI